MLQRVSSPTFVGRAAQLRALEAALARAAAGTPAFVFVAGESGVGKSRLVRELEARARGAGARVLVGHCIELGGSEVPYAPLVAAFRPVARELSDGRSGLLPELGGGDRDTAPEPEERSGRQIRLFEGLLGLIERLGRSEPVVLVLEDIHWADPSTRHFLAFLVRTARAEPLCLVVTYRSDELHRRHPLRPLLAELERAAGVDRLELERFTRAELRQQLSGILGEAPDDDLVDRLYDRSAGNPLYSEELLAATAEGGPDLPETLRDALLMRVERLPANAQRVVSVAAVVERALPHALLRAASPLSDAELLEGAREAVVNHVLVPDADGAYAFRHALVGEAVYTDLLPGERSAVHAKIAEALEAQPDLLGDASAATLDTELARHWYAAHDLPRALTAAVRAARAAAGVYAFGEAQRHVERALELWDRVPGAAELTGEEHVDLLRHAAAMANTVGEASRAVALTREAIAEVDELADPRRAAHLYQHLGGFLRQVGDSVAGLDAFERAMELLPRDAPPLELARVQEAYARSLMLTARSAEAARMAAQARDTARAAGQKGIEGRALNVLGFLQAATGDVDGGVALGRRAAELAREARLPDDHVRAIVNLTESLDLNGRTAEALEIARETLARDRRERPERTSYDAFLALQAVNHLVRLGRLEEAWRELPERVPGDQTHNAALYLHELRTRTAILRGRLSDAEQHLQGLRRFGLTVLEPQWTEPAYRLAAELALLQDRPDDAREQVARGLPLLEQGEDMLLINKLCWTGLRTESDIAARARALSEPIDTAFAQRLLDAVVRTEGRPQYREAPAYAALARAEVTRLRGELGEAPDPSEWAAAAAAFKELGLPWPAAYARFREAEAHVAAGAYAEATEPLRAAHASAATMGARPLEDDIAALARRARIDLDPAEPTAEAEPSPADRLGLTPREHEVLLLVAEGRTNREIGAELYMSEKTASVHVSRILAKLGVSSRVEAAAVAHRLGLTARRASAHPPPGGSRQQPIG